jgi:DNA polymerase I
MTDASPPPPTPQAPPTPGAPPGGPGSLFLFDAYNFVFRAYHALPMLNAPDGTPVNAVHGLVRMVQAVRRDLQPELVAAVFDAGGDGGRRALLPSYKANRPPAPADLVPQFPLVRKAVEALGIPRLEHPDYEADDLIASYAKAAQAAGMRVVIVSSDKDLMQLCDAGDPTSGRTPIYLYDTMKQRLIGPPEVEEKFGVPPAKLGDLLALTGDSSDNVPGVPGVGPKTAAELLHEHGSLEGVLAAAPAMKQKKRREKLCEHADDARVSRRLVALCDDIPLPVPLPALADTPPDDGKLVELFEPLGLKLVLRELGSAAAIARARQLNAGDEIGAMELQPIADFSPAGSAHRVLLAGDDEALAAYATALVGAEQLAIHLAVDGDDALRAELVGVAIAAQGLPGPLAQPVYVPVGRPRQGDMVDARPLDRAAVLAALRPVLESPTPPKVAHDHKRQALVLRRHGVALRGVVLDPMLAS